MATQGMSRQGLAPIRKDPSDWLEVREDNQRSGLASRLFFVFPLIAAAALVAAFSGMF